MKTIALRFGEHFAPECGTIAAHNELIEKYGHVWYGKMGTPISETVISQIMECANPQILLIHSGKARRYWAYVQKITKELPPLQEIPSYYRDMHEKFKCWFKVTSFEAAPHDIMSRCNVASSGASLSEASKHSMSPYFIIEYKEGD